MTDRNYILLHVHQMKNDKENEPTWGRYQENNTPSGGTDPGFWKGGA